MILFTPLIIIKFSSLLIIPLIDLTISILNYYSLNQFSFTDYSGLLLYFLNIIQSFLYIVNFDFNSNSKIYNIYYLSCISFLVYLFSLLFEIFSIYPISKEKSLLSVKNQSLLSPNSNLHISIFSQSNDNLINNIANSIIINSPAMTNISKKSTDKLLFKIDDILSPYKPITSTILAPNNDDLLLLNNNFEDDDGDEDDDNYNEEIQIAIHEQQQNTYINDKLKVSDDSTNVKFKSNRFNSSDTAPILATLLALSSPSYTTAAPIIESTPIPISHINNSFIGILNFILSFLINLLNLRQSLFLSPLILTKLIINMFIWLISLFVPKSPSSGSFNQIPILFDNKVLILINLIVATMAIFTAMFQIIKNNNNTNIMINSTSCHPNTVICSPQDKFNIYDASNPNYSSIPNESS